MKNLFSTRSICVNAVICAFYVVLTIISGPLAFAGGSFQLRLSEILVFFVFFNPSYSIGIILGCFLSNMLSMYGLFDLIIGTFSTAISCLLIYILSRKVKVLFFAGSINVLINSLVVPFIFIFYDKSLMNFNAYIVLALWTMLGEVIVILVGYVFLLIVFKKTKNLHKFIGSSQNMDFKW